VVVVVVGSVVVVVVGGGSVSVVVVVVGGGGAAVVVVVGGGLEGEVVDVGLEVVGVVVGLLAGALDAVDLAFGIVATGALLLLEFEAGRAVSGSDAGFVPGGGVVDVLGPGTVPVEDVGADVDRVPVVDGVTAG
jgi:hypothetical protein